MQRFKVALRYSGGAFHGWQSNQKGCDIDSVQGTIAAAVRRLMPDYHATVQGSGRTDTGVHAMHQVFHVDLVRARLAGPGMLNAAGELVPGDSAADAAAAAADAAAAAAVPARPAKLAKSKQPGESGDAAPAPASGGVSLAGIYRPPGKRPFKQQPRLAQLRVVKRPDGSTIPYDCDPLTVKEPLQPSQLVLALNSAFRELLHSDTVLEATAAERVGFDFHARHSAYMRKYTYRIHFGPGCMFERDRAWCVDATPEAIDIPAMAEAAAKLVGTHDFSSFRALECSAPNPVRSLEYIAMHWEPSLSETVSGSPYQFPDDAVAATVVAATSAAGQTPRPASSTGTCADADADAEHAAWSFASARERLIREAHVASFPRNLARARAAAELRGRGAYVSSAETVGPLPYTGLDADAGTDTAGGSSTGPKAPPVADSATKAADLALGRKLDLMFPPAGVIVGPPRLPPRLTAAGAAPAARAKSGTSGAHAHRATQPPFAASVRPDASRVGPSRPARVPEAVKARDRARLKARAALTMQMLSSPDSAAGPVNGPQAAGCAPVPVPSLSGRGRVLVLTIMSRAFLHSQVRILTGFLMAVGEGKIKPADVETIFAGGGRWANPAPTAPPEGLFLSGVYYPPTPEDMVEWRRWK